ncbi:MAG: glycosyltransferase 2 family protein [Abditibacteriota bacterium]|nr:glycosyltransferase 2 family protein [Abditibacteriota bacterium]
MNQLSTASSSPTPFLPQHVRRRSSLIFAGKCALGALLVWWLMRSGRLDLGLLTRASMGWPLAGAIMCQSAMIACQTMRWHLLARAQGFPMTPHQTIATSLRGQFAGAWTPSNLGLDGVRLLHAGRLSPGRSRTALVALIVDRVIGVLMLLALLLPLLFFTPRPEHQMLFTFARYLAAAGAILTLLALLSWKASSRRALLPDGFIGHVLAALNAYHEQPKVLWSACAWALATHLFNALSFWFGFGALGLPAHPFTVIMMAPAVVLSYIVPLTPMGLGVADAVAATLFSAVGIAGGGATTMLLRATWLLLSLLCGLAFFYRDGLPSGVESNGVGDIGVADSGLEKAEGVDAAAPRNSGAMVITGNDGIGGNAMGRD